jgi:N-methylhydantoinase A
VHFQHLSPPVFHNPRADAGEVPASRRAYFRDHGWLDTHILRRSDLTVETRVSGPAIVEQHDTTIVIHPSQRAEVDAAGNLFIRFD